MAKYKLAVLTSHPIQYQAPLFKAISGTPEIDLTVYFSWDNQKEGGSYDEEFKKKFKWDTPIFEGYRYEFLKNFSPWPSSSFWGQINPGIVNELRKNHYDAILVFGWNGFTKIIAFLGALLFKTPVFLVGENPLNQELQKGNLKIRIKKIILSLFFKGIKKFFYIGKENKDFYKYYGVPENKLIFFPYAVQNQRFMEQADRLVPQKERLKNKLGLKKDDFVILFAGKLIDKKRPFDLLRAYEKVKNPPKALIFVGDGELRETLQNYTRKNNLEKVIFAGFKNQNEMPEYYALSDVLVLPSGMGETWGLVVNEAMCFGLPIIVSRMVGCGPDLIIQGENGYIFPLGNIERLAQYLGDLTKDFQKRKSFGKKSLAIVQNYSYENDIKAILSALTA